ncbi:Glucuronosyltransferase [Aphelenchoides fujianensis]|nr:Glucuronosyltransferase [Aphelenchoides fujianensis]
MIASFYGRFCLLATVLVASNLQLVSTRSTEGPLRVLVLSSNVGTSHLQVAGALADALVDAGHKVDFLIPMWNSFVTSNGTKKANIRRLQLPNTAEIEAAMLAISSWNDAFEATVTAADWIAFGRMCAMHCEPLLTDRRLHAELRAARYDVAMAESFDLCAFALFRMLGVRSTHEFSNLPLGENSALAHGLPVDWWNQPVFTHHNQIEPIRTIGERVANWIEWTKLRFYTLPRQYGDADATIRRILGPGFPTGRELLRAVDYVWENTNEQLATPRLTSGRVKQIGGIAVPRVKELSEVSATDG